MTTPSGAKALRHRVGAVMFASQSGQSTGALLILAGVAATRPGHPGGAQAGLASLAARRRSRGPGRNVMVWSRPGR